MALSTRLTSPYCCTIKMSACLSRPVETGRWDRRREMRIRNYGRRKRRQKAAPRRGEMGGTAVTERASFVTPPRCAQGAGRNGNWS